MQGWRAPTESTCYQLTLHAVPTSHWYRRLDRHRTLLHYDVKRFPRGWLGAECQPASLCITEAGCCRWHVGCNRLWRRHAHGAGITESDAMNEIEIWWWSAMCWWAVVLIISDNSRVIETSTIKPKQNVSCLFLVRHTTYCNITAIKGLASSHCWGCSD